PGQIGAGSQGDMGVGPAGQSLPGALRPYDQVLGEYGAQARQHLAQNPVPDEMAALVEAYFTDLAGGSR
ncbi:MAG TPA: hypothetical protein VK191_08805, partial [Symbiobacteriaceae bacterium]|nr:hypothetical protein [Symbiobacteriaceae bacterium]